MNISSILKCRIASQLQTIKSLFCESISQSISNDKLHKLIYAQLRKLALQLEKNRRISKVSLS